MKIALIELILIVCDYIINIIISVMITVIIFNELVDLNQTVVCWSMRWPGCKTFCIIETGYVPVYVSGTVHEP